MQTYTIGPVSLNLEKDNHFTPVEMKFQFSIPFCHIVPDDMEQATEYHNSVSRTIKFFQGLHTAYITESSYDETEMFVTGRINNISVEVPDGCNKVPLLGAIFYHKANALMDEFPIDEFKLSFKLIENGRESVETELVYNDMTYMGSKIEAIIQHYEDEWQSELRSEYDELSEQPHIDPEKDLNDHPVVPWWRRRDGQVRDFVNINLLDEYVENDNADEGAPVNAFSALDDIRVLSVDIGENEMFEFPEIDDNDSDDGGNDDGYHDI